jgi:hypothetical protein
MKLVKNMKGLKAPRASRWSGRAPPARRDRGRNGRGAEAQKPAGKRSGMIGGSTFQPGSVPQHGDARPTA